MEVGKNVTTNAGYVKRFGRRVFGTVIDIHEDAVCVVNVKKQVGNIIPEHTGNNVVFLVRDLEEI